MKVAFNIKDKISQNEILKLFLGFLDKNTIKQNENQMTMVVGFRFHLTKLSLQ